MNTTIPSLFTRARLVASGLSSIAIALLASAATPEALRHTGGLAFWQTRGNSFILEQRGDQFRMFESTRLSLLPIGSGVIRDGMLVYHDAPVIPAAEFFGQSDRICRLPQAAIAGPTNDAVKLFDVFWTTIDENYAFFNLLPKNTWRKLYAQYRPRVRPGTTSEELWQIFSAMIRSLHDGHTMLFDLTNGQQAFSRDPSPSSWMLDDATGALSNDYAASIISHLDAFGPEQVAGTGPIPSLFFGTIAGQVGYINILSYADYGERGLTPPIEGDSAFSVLTSFGSFTDEPEPFAALLDRVLTEFADLPALIIDLRFNAGGSGDLPVEFANRLTARSRLAYKYRVRNGSHEQFERPVSVRLTPKTPAFLNKPVIVLTSNNTKSAGDLHAMILRELPNVVLIGERTYGIFSEGIPRQIPINTGVPGQGWALTVSTQRLYSARGEFFEQRGVPPDIALAPDAAALAHGTDNMLEAALEFLAEPAL